MATAEQIKSLIRSHFDDDRERFITIALQLAAHEAKRGHASVAYDIRDLIDKGRKTSVNIVDFNHELDGLIIAANPRPRLGSLVVSEDIQHRLERILQEYYIMD